MQGLLIELVVSSALTGGVAPPPVDFDGLGPRLYLLIWMGCGVLQTERADAGPVVCFVGLFDWLVLSRRGWFVDQRSANTMQCTVVVLYCTAAVLL